MKRDADSSIVECPDEYLSAIDDVGNFTEGRMSSVSWGEYETQTTNLQLC